MSFFDDVKVAAPLTAVPNLGCLLDIPTGGPVIGLKGETITNGGFHPINGIVGEGNVGKTQLALYMYVILLGRYADAHGLVYDTETTLKKIRQIIAAETNAPHLLYTDEEVIENDRIDEYDIKQSTFVTAVEYLGDEMYKLMKDKMSKRPTTKAAMLTSPFKDRDGKPLQIQSPIAWMIDSFSLFQVSSMDEMKENDLGHSKRNMEAMRDAHAKNQLLLELPVLTAKHGLYTILTAHLGAQHQLDPRTPPKKILAYLSQKQKIKNVPEKFLFVPHNVFMVYGTNTLYNSSSDKTPMYPKHADVKKSSKHTDLTVANILSLRNKAGVSGSPFELIMSQTEGLLATLSEFHYCKTLGRFGYSVSGSGGVIMAMDLYPDETFTRITLRDKIREDEKLRNAIRLTSEILQISEFWAQTPRELLVSPKELYEGLKKQGYDWDELLMTRGHWTPDQYTNPVRFLSGMDLLNMYAGIYKPYWQKK